MNAKLFRAIVVMGVSLTAACDDDSSCLHCSPAPVDANIVADAQKPADAGVDAPAPSDAPVDTVLIL